MDEATGLPTLPEGYFYRIKKWNHGTFDLAVQVRRRFWGVSYKVSERLAQADHDSIVWGAQRARQMAFPKPVVDHIIEFVGDYPPKRLER